MVSTDLLQSSAWYVLNHIGGSSHETARKAVDRFNAWSHKNLELFAPTYVVRESKGGEVRLRTANLTFHYVFVRGLFPDVKDLCGQSNGFSFLINRGGSERYATVDDRTMSGFRNIARAYKNCLPYYSLADVDLEEGDLVEVVKGDFPGLVGTYIPHARSRSGNIVLNIYNNVGTIAFDVKATDVRVLEFSRKSSRANDQMDAFLPHLLSALRYYHGGEALPDSLASKLSVFVGRMGVAKLPNRKLDARLQMLLYAAHHIIGNMSEAQAALDRYKKLESSVTNVWTLGLHTLLESVLENNLLYLSSPKVDLYIQIAQSRNQKLIIDEYTYYLN